MRLEHNRPRSKKEKGMDEVDARVDRTYLAPLINPRPEEQNHQNNLMNMRALV
jgi:hypothetical protein